MLLGALVAASMGMGCSDRDPPPEVDAGGGADTGGAADAAPDTGEDAAMEMDAGTDAGTDAGPLTGDNHVYVLDFIDVGAAEEGGDPTIVPGFDLDMRVSDGTDVETCRREDFTSPAPDSEPGIDNRLGPTLASQEEMLRVRASMINNVRAGRVLVLLDVQGVDDFTNDDRVEVHVYFGLLPVGVDTPELTPDLRYVPGQTFDIDPRSLGMDEMVAVRLGGRIVDGRLDAGPGTLSFAVPFDDEIVLLDIKRVRARFDITETGLSNGVIGGSLDVQQTAERIAPVTDFDEATLEIILRGSADLDRVMGRCESVSLAMVFDGTTAALGEVR